MGKEVVGVRYLDSLSLTVTMSESFPGLNFSDIFVFICSALYRYQSNISIHYPPSSDFVILTVLSKHYDY